MTAKGPRPKYWYSVANDPDHFIRCEWNPTAKKYNSNCQVVPKGDVDPNLKMALTRLANAIEKYHIEM